MRWYSPRDWEEEEGEGRREEEGTKPLTKPLSGISEQLAQQTDKLSSLVMSERLGDWGDEGEDWDVILGSTQTGAKDETKAASEVKVKQPSPSKDGSSKRVSVSTSSSSSSSSSSLYSVCEDSHTLRSSCVLMHASSTCPTPPVR